MKKQLLLLTIILTCMLFGSRSVSAESLRDYSGGWSPHVSDRVIARAAVGALPKRLISSAFILEKSGSVILASEEFAEYTVRPNGRDVKTEVVISFLQQAVPASCVDFDHIQGLPGGYIGGGTASPINVETIRDAAKFSDQWAFEQIEHDPLKPRLEGDETLIAILDAFQSNSADIWDSPTISHATPTNLLSVKPPNAPNVELHGSLVTSLAQSVAPRSSIMQVSVLNEWGVGHLFGVIESLNFVFESFAHMPQEYLVINMSFGSDQADQCGIVEALLTAGRSRYNALYVASAGNNSTSSVSTAPLYPASSPQVIAVAASTNVKTLAFYSHNGDVMAPGGELTNSMIQPCNRLNDVIIGYAPIELNQPPVILCSIGTSFAAPLVAGLGATLFNASTPLAETVQKHIKKGAGQNGGVIDVAFSQAVLFP
ncbi:MAG: S8/S53 family peptidase [Candidatus Promineifilaceae bacterium]